MGEPFRGHNPESPHSPGCLNVLSVLWVRKVVEKGFPARAQ